MLILIGIVPTYFALDHSLNPLDMRESLQKVELVMSQVNPNELSADNRRNLVLVRRQTATLDSIFAGKTQVAQLPQATRFQIRKAILLTYSRAKQIVGSDNVSLSTTDRNAYEAAIGNMRTFTDYAPWWVLLMVSTSLGLGTMIGWQRIVKTIGERIGKEHLTYAQGATSELVAAAMIGSSTWLGLPSSTTQVLTSSVAGSMVASRGVKNINPGMIRNIALAWVLTLPVTMFLAGGLFLLFRAMIG